MNKPEFVTDLRQNEVNDIRIPIRWLHYHLPDPNDQREYARERARVVISEAIGEALEESGLSRTQLAEKLGVTKGHVSQVLSGARNMTLRTLGDLMWACGVELHEIETRRLGVVMASPETASDWLEACRVEAKYETSATLLSHPQAAERHVPLQQVSTVNRNLALAA